MKFSKLFSFNYRDTMLGELCRNVSAAHMLYYKAITITPSALLSLGQKPTELITSPVGLFLCHESSLIWGHL